MTHQLAIVIPVYRGLFLRQSLESLNNQTCKAFKVYIGDDASSDPIKDIAAEFSGGMSIAYTRFNSNLGGVDLVEQWARCIALTDREPWLWLFSDDDIAGPSCVEDFLRVTADPHLPRVDLYRFQMDIVDQRGICFSKPAPHPAFETPLEFMKALMTDRHREWRAPDHIFSRAAYQRENGFTKFPLAIYSDYATWLKFSRLTGVRSIPRARVQWRSHPTGTSSGQREKHRALWQSATRQYITFLKNFSQNLGNEASTFFQKHSADVFFRELTFFQPPFHAEERSAALQYARDELNRTTLQARLHLDLAFMRYFIVRWKIVKAINGWRRAMVK